jgi:hypothetical protein
MQIFQLSSFPIEQAGELNALEHKLGSWFASLTYPVRLLAMSKAFDLRPAIGKLNRNQREFVGLSRVAGPLMRAIDALIEGDGAADPSTVIRELSADELGLLLDLFAHEPPLQQLLLGNERIGGDDAVVLWAAIGDALDSILWRLPWMKEQVRFYEELQRRHLRSATYILITWEPPEVSATSIAATLRSATGRPVTILDQLPSVIPGAYSKQSNRLRPVQPGMPYLAAAISYELQGELDATTLHTLLNASFDVALAIDIVTIPRNKAQRTAELAYNAARLLAGDSKLMDTRAVGVRASAQRVMFELKRQGLHTVQLGVLVGGETPEDLEANIAETQSRLGTQIRWMRPPNQQAELLKLWSTTPRTQIDAPLKPRSILSHGVGCLAGVLGYHRASNTEGPFWGIDAARRAPLFFNLFANNQAAHMTLLGMTGFGKTFFLNLLTLRSAVVMGTRIIGIDDFDNGPRIAGAAGAGATCYMLSMDTPINILDVVYDEDAEGGWLTNQVQHAIGQLALLLGRPGKTLDGKERLIPRDFEPEEAGVLDRALMMLYQNVTPSTPLRSMPLLSDLIEILSGLREPEAQRLARTIRIKLFGSDDPNVTEPNSAGKCFNRHTEVDWRFGSDISYYNTANVPTMYRPFFYLQIIGAILRFMRDPNRDRSRKTMLAIDEFGYVTQVESLARLAAMICKVARKYGIGLIAIDQNPLTFLESETGRYIFENCQTKVSFRLDDTPARQLASTVRDMNEEHIAELTHFAPGQCLAIVRNDVYVVNVETSPRELRAFKGS